VRTLFLVLLLANIGFFAWWFYLAPPDGNIDPLPLTRQIAPERLRIVPPGEQATGGIALKPALAAAAPAPAAGAGAPPGGCFEWGSFTLADAPRAEKALEPLGLGSRLAQRRTEETAGWWVFIPPQGSRPGAAKKAAELKALGIDEYFIVADEGEWRWAVSLGVFRSEEAAQARLAALRQRGVKSAQVGPRETVVAKIWLQVKGLDAGLEARVKEVVRQLEGSELRPCGEAAVSRGA
jgi:hypothetical protein